MRRRDIPNIILATAAGTTLKYASADAQTGNTRLYPVTPAESKANVTPTNYECADRPWLDPKREGCTMDGNTDDYDTFQRCLKVVGTTYAGIIIDGPLKLGTNTTIPANVMLQFVGGGRLQPGAHVTIVVEGSIGAGAHLPPWDLTAAGSNVVTPATKVLGATEGVTSTSYVSALMHGLVVPTENPKNLRYWTANFTLEVPAETKIPDMDVRQDHVSISGHSMTAAPHSRIWGVVGASVNSHAANSNAEVGTCLGAEFDVNNNTGYDLNNLNGNGDLGGVMIASGGKSTAKFGICMSKLTTAKGFFAGWWVRQGSIDPQGFLGYFGGISPTYGFNFATDYTGGACMITPVGVNAVEMRTATGNSVRMLSLGTVLKFNGGTGGTIWSNNTDSQINAQLSDAGVYQAFALAHRQQSKQTNSERLDAALGGQVICKDTVATVVSSIINAKLVGQQMTIIAYTDKTTISTSAAKLNAAANFRMPMHGTLRLEWDGTNWFETGRKV